VEITGSYREGVAFSGPVKEALDAATRKAGVIWSIQDGELQILDRQAASTAGGAKLSPTTGMVGKPTPLNDEIQIDQRRKGSGYEVRSLLNPKIRPGERVLIEGSSDADGVYRVDTVEHKGSVRGNDWYSVAEVYSD
jgi:hypothetical protein